MLKALECYRRALADDLEIAGHRVTSAVVYLTGKYDVLYPPTEDFFFPDEGIRFYFVDKLNHMTVRPSGTGNSLRFHVQLHAPVNESNLVETKQQLMTQAKMIVDEIRERLDALRNES